MLVVVLEVISTTSVIDYIDDTAFFITPHDDGSQIAADKTGHGDNHIGDVSSIEIQLPQRYDTMDGVFLAGRTPAREQAQHSPVGRRHMQPPADQTRLTSQPKTTRLNKTARRQLGREEGTHLPPSTNPDISTPSQQLPAMASEPAPADSPLPANTSAAAAATSASAAGQSAVGEGGTIGLLAEATLLAREALAQNASPANDNLQPHSATTSQPHPQPQLHSQLQPQPHPHSHPQMDGPESHLPTAATPPPRTDDPSLAAAATPTAVVPAPEPASTPRAAAVPPLAIPDGRAPATPVDSPPDEMAISPAVPVHPNLGSKRTASGAIKAPPTSSSTSLPATPYQPAAPLAPASASPRAGRERIGELSNQLRSRLSYAMIKMQNGLQGQSFDQVEHFIAEKRQNRLSQSPSIAAATPFTGAASSASVAPFAGAVAGAAAAALKRQTSADSYSGGLGIALLPSSSAPPVSPRVTQARIGRHARTTSDPSAMYLAPAANIASQHDPNYWVKPPPSPRPSNVRGTVEGSPSQSAQDSSFAGRFQSSPRHLAPAAPIRHHGVVRHHHTLPARRGKLPPPSLPKTFSNMSNMSSVSNAPTDVLSLVDEPISSQTAVPSSSQTAADAVESLMFLSSPGHSQHRGSRPASRSAMSTHQPQFQSQLIQQVWNGSSQPPPTDLEGDSFMGETAASTIVDDEEEVRLVEEEDELDRELDRQRKNQEYSAPDTEVNGVRVKTMEEVLSAAERADAAAHWGYAKAGAGTEKASAAPVAPSPMLSG
ncbi:hypothetical protein Dda_7844 [Drechslerella dactyloides]|uniref:Uncharacterized protein n=1 Tax=Drechslerella dactyloides TaxID=74499 RepID=A0AAD6NF09_DREDA|nr:hypothetical protein Dda_7844 [Drechslerella dactyloides]